MLLLYGKKKQIAHALALSACLISAAAPAIAKRSYVSTADEFYKATLVGGDAQPGDSIVLSNDMPIPDRQGRITANDLTISGSADGTTRGLVAAPGHGDDELIRLDASGGGALSLANLALQGGCGIYIADADSSGTGYTLNLNSVTFSGSTHGAIFSEVPLAIDVSGDVPGAEFKGNSSDGGGAVRVENVDLTLNAKGPVVVSGNSATDGNGGAFYTDFGSIRLSGNDSITFSGNSANGNAGALGAAIIGWEAHAK